MPPVWPPELLEEELPLLPALDPFRCDFDSLLRCERLPVVPELPLVDELPIESVPMPPLPIEPVLPEPILPVPELPEPMLPVDDPLCPLPAPEVPPDWADTAAVKLNTAAEIASF